MQKTMPGLREQNPLVFYLRTLLYMLLALLLRIVTFAPLLTLFIPSELPFWPWLSLLCPVLFFFFLLPLRFSFAEALVQTGSPRRFGFDTAFSLRQYFEKLWRGFVHFLSVLKWCLPLGAAAFFAYLQMDQGVNVLLDQLTQLGLWAGNLAAGVGTFLRNLFGDTTPLEIHGGWAEGLLALAVVIALLLLIAAIGVMRNSATRYVWAYASQYHRNPRSENRRRVKNRRWTQLGFALINLLLWAPFLAGLWSFLPGLFSDLSSQLMLLIGTQQMDTSFFSQKTGQLLFAFFVLYLPFLPLRRMITAFFAAKSIRFAHSSPLSGSAQPAVEPAEASGSSLLQDEDAEDGLPPLSQVTPVPEPVPAWPKPQDSAKHTAPYQPSAQEVQEAIREAPSLWTPEPQETSDSPVVAEASPDAPQEKTPEAELGAEASPAPASPEAASAQSPAQQPRQDVDPSAFTIGQ